MYQVTHRNGERCSAAKGYITPHLSRPNLTVVTERAEARILFEGKRAVGVALPRRATSCSEVRARREVIVCGGRLRLAAAADALGHRPGAELQRLGIAVVHDLPGVGQNLQDHIDHVQTWRTRSDTADLRRVAARQRQA